MYCTYVQVSPSGISCVQPCSRGESHRAEQGGWLYATILSHIVEAYHLQQQLSICHYLPACTYAYIMQKHCVHVQYVDKMYVHRKCQQSAEAIQRIITGKIIINYRYIIQWNLCQQSPELGARLA